MSTEKSAFRTIQIVDTLIDLVESRMTLNLNEPNSLDDTSWIKPGVSMWDWRILGAEEGDFTYEQNTPSIKRLIDFAAENDLAYVLIDAGWYGDGKA